MRVNPLISDQPGLQFAPVSWISSPCTLRIWFIRVLLEHPPAGNRCNPVHVLRRRDTRHASGQEAQMTRRNTSHSPVRSSVPALAVAAFFAALAAAEPPLPAQQPQPPNTATAAAADEDEEEGPLVADSTVGYIDTAILGNQLRFRYDSNYNATQPARAEFLWPVGGRRGPGPGPDTSVDYQDLSLYSESRLSHNLSVFGELPVRFLDPEIQDNTAGLGDANVGLKYALQQSATDVQSFQLRLYVPTADASRGLGTDHYSLEPGFLFYQTLAPRLTGFAELKDWIAMGGSDGFAGNILRYGLGTSYLLMQAPQHRNVSAVTEFVGWTVLHGGSAITTPGPVTRFVDATGDTIVNAKVGLRTRLSENYDLYAGYGRAITGDTWYSDMLRLELRWCW
jgi:hypothetical protein